MQTQQMIPLTMRFRPAEKLAIENYATKNNKSASQVIREVLTPFLKEITRDDFDDFLREINKIEITDKEWVEFDKALKENRKQQLELQIKRDARMQKMFED